jgi:LPXTG-motif cell wall-anchored protein
VAIAPGVASAHHPIVSGATQCRTGDTWTVTWTARADADRAFTWQITSPSGYSPAGSQADELPFTRTASYPASQASATENVSALWSNNATGSGSATVDRPPLCDVPTTTTTTTTLPEVTTTTTQPAVTTTTIGSESSTTIAEPTTTVEQAGPTTTAVGQSGPTSSVDQSSGAAATTSPIAGALPATGAGDGSLNLIVIALTLMGIGAVMLRLATRPTR